MYQCLGCAVGRTRGDLGHLLLRCRGRKPHVIKLALRPGEGQMHLKPVHGGDLILNLSSLLRNASPQLA